MNLDVEKNNKKIAIKATSYLGISPNGAEPFTLLFFCEYLEEFGYQVNLIGAEVLPEELKKYKNYTYIKYLYLPRLLRMFLHIPISILNVFIFSFKEKPDLLMCVGGVFYNGLSIYLVGKILKIKSLVRTAEDHFNCYKFCSTIRSRAFHYFINYKISKHVLKHADYILTTGIKSREYFISKGIQEDRVFGIPGKIELNNFYHEPSSLKQELGIPDESRIILYVGALSGLKGADFLPKIIKKVNKNSNEFYFLIVGNENEYGSKIKEEIINIRAENVIFLKSQHRDKLKQIYSIGDVLIFLCRVGVGYGQVTLEATSCELPVLSLNPGIDVEWWLRENCCDSINIMVERILSKKYKVAKIPPSFDESSIKVEYAKLFNSITN